MPRSTKGKKLAIHKKKTENYEIFYDLPNLFLFGLDFITTFAKK